MCSGLIWGPLCRTLFKEQNQVPEPGDLEVLPARVTDFGPRKGILRMKCETEFQNFHSGENLKSRLLTLLSVLPLNNVVQEGPPDKPEKHKKRSRSRRFTGLGGFDRR